MKKKMKSFLSVLLSLLLLLACFAPVSAVAGSTRPRAVIAKAPRYLNPSMPSGIDSALPWDDFFDALDTLLFTDATSVDVSEYAIPYTNSNWEYIQSRAFSTPKLLHIPDWTITPSGQINEPGSIVSKLNYQGDSAANLAKRQACEDSIFKLTYDIKHDATLTDYDKVLILHDRLATWTAYDNENLLKDVQAKKLDPNAASQIPNDSFSAYGALVTQVAVCEGYSMALSWIFDELGIENYYTTSKALNHGWLKLVLDSKAYYFDVTYDDPVWDVPGQAQHGNFLIPYAVFVQNHSGATDYDQSVTATDYVNSFDKTSNSEIVRIGDYFYYMKTNTHVEIVDNEPALFGDPTTLVRRPANADPSDTTVEPEELLEVSPAYYTNYTREDPNDPLEPDAEPIDHGTWLYMPKMTAIGNNLLYTAGRKVYAYNVTTGVKTLVFDDDSNAIFNNNEEFLLMGLRQQDGVVYITAFNDNRFDRDTVESFTTSFRFCNHDNENRLVYLNGAPAHSCTEMGSVTYYCQDCRAVFVDETAPGSHNYDDPVVTPATCVSVSVSVYTCTLCGHSYTEYGTAFDPTNHPLASQVEVGAVDATCKTPAYTAGVYCKACNTYISGHVATGDPNGNNHTNLYTSKQPKAPTCTEGGWTAETSCHDCNSVVTPSTPIANLGHDYLVPENGVVAPTCTAQGYTLHVCSRCPSNYKDSYVDALNHPQANRVPTEAVTATCLTVGYTEGVKCTLCGGYVSGHELIPKDMTNHVGEETMVGKKDAACEVAGYTGDLICSACGTVFEKGEVIAALEHQWDNGDVLVEPTCTDSGTRKYTCSICNGTKVERIEKLGHIDMNGNEICDRCKRNLSKDACPYCNQIHKGGLSFVTKFFHKMLYLFLGEKNAQKKSDSFFKRLFG